MFAIAVLACASVVTLACGEDEPADANEDVWVTGGGPAYSGEAADAQAEAQRRADFDVSFLDAPDYEIFAIGVQDDIPGSDVRRVELLYRNPGAVETERTLTITQWTGRQSILSGGRQEEPAPIPTSINVPGAELFEVPFDDGRAGFTAYAGGKTYHIVFAVAPARDEMMSLIEALLAS